jgi:hypothetical protein
MMYPRTNYEMTEADLQEILDACKPVPAMMIGGTLPSSPQENANNAWRRLGGKMGFDHMTVQPIGGKGNRFFSAVPTEPEEVRAERLEREAEEKRVAEIARLEAEIARMRAEIDGLNEGKAAIAGALDRQEARLAEGRGS